jgi:subtilase family serine protease
MKTRVSIHSFYGAAVMLALAAFSCALGFGGVLYFAGSGHADDGALLVGNHPVEAENFRQLGEADSTKRLEMQIRFALRHRAALDKLLAEQQNPASANYHKWLTTDEFLRRFGPSESEIDAITNWLASEGFTVTRHLRNSLEFTGPVAQAQRTFAVRIAKFGDGSVYANTSDPIIPKRFAGIVGSVLGMDNMVHAVPMSHQRGMSANAPVDLAVELAQAESEVPAAPDAIVNGAQAFGPSDLRTFYDETVGAGQDGSGSCIAIIGASDFLDATMTVFTSQFGLPAINYTRVLSGSNPGLNSAEAESELDLQWSHVTAPGASINFHLGSDLVSDIAGAVNANACGVISISYGLCGVSASYMTSVIDPIFSQAAAQGQSVFISAGDQGAAGIALNSNGTACVVNNTRSVNEMSADPNVTSVGGTQFTPTYSGGNDQGYASERVWNDSSGATGGGASQVFAKPAYQKGSGVPNDGARDVPDVALIASPNSPGVFFADDVNGGAQVVCCIGGTSLSAPVWAGFASVIGQISGNSRLGNFNQIIYPLANKQYSAAGFHDITNGNNNFNGVTGFSAGPGYDLASGWGTIDFEVFASAAKTFLAQSSSPTPSATPTPTKTASPTATRTAMATPTRSATRTATATAKGTATATSARTATGTATAMPTRTATKIATPTATGTATLIPTRTATKIATPTVIRTVTATPTRRATGTMTPTIAATPIPTASPLSSPTPIIVTFPTTPIRAFALQTLTIPNRNTSTLSVSVGTLAAPFAVYYPGVYNVPPGWTLTLMLSFTPLQTGSASQQLLIGTNDPRNPKLTVAISGVAISQSGASRKSRPELSALQPRLRAP